VRIAFTCKRALAKAIPVQRLIPGVTGLMLLGFFGMGQAQQGIVLQNFKFTPGDYYAPPHQKQPKSLLTGQKAEEKAGRYFITGGKCETFLENGTREMLVEAPSCVYEKSTDQSIHSPGPLRVVATDEKFSISGEGFRWQTNSSLFISNRVHTIIHPEVLQSNNTARATFPTNKVQADNKGIEIVSEHLDYMGESGIGNYRKNVRVTGTDLEMSAGNLQFLLPIRERQLRRMTADENVDLTSGEVRVTGQHVDYTVDNGIIQVTGNPAWQASQREGRADDLFIDRSNQVFRAIGHALLKLSDEGKGTSPFLSGTSPSGTNQIIEIRSDSYEIRTNSAEFSSQVIVTERLGDQPRATLTCGRLMATFAASNQMERMLAEENVVMEQGARRFSAGQAVFTGTNQLLALTRNPTWQDGPRTGQADVIFLKGQENQLTAQGNASLRLPAGSIGPAGVSNAPAPLGMTNDFAEISSSEYTLSTNSALFQGGVTVKHPQMNLNCKTLTLDVPTSEVRAQTLVAQDEVHFTLNAPKGEKINGTAERAVYTYSVDAGKTNDIIELTGNPRLTLADGSTFENKVIILDRANGKLIAPGKYLVRNFGSPVVSNDFPLMKLNPGKKRKR
jgi:lipopolysaccharide export system protein LptA